MPVTSHLNISQLSAKLWPLSGTRFTREVNALQMLVIDFTRPISSSFTVTSITGLLSGHKANNWLQISFIC